MHQCNSCPDCSPNKDCYCCKCPCGTIHICINCVNLYTEDRMYKTIKVECIVCNKTSFFWCEV